MDSGTQTRGRELPASSKLCVFGEMLKLSLDLVCHLGEAAPRSQGEGTFPQFQVPLWEENFLKFREKPPKHPAPLPPWPVVQEVPWAPTRMVLPSPTPPGAQSHTADARDRARLSHGHLSCLSTGIPFRDKNGPGEEARFVPHTVCWGSAARSRDSPLHRDDILVRKIISR